MRIIILYLHIIKIELISLSYSPIKHITISVVLFLFHLIIYSLQLYYYHLFVIYI